MLYTILLGIAILIFIVLKAVNSYKGIYTKLYQEVQEYLDLVYKAKMEYIIQPFPITVNLKYQKHFKFFERKIVTPKAKKLKEFLDIYKNLDEYRKLWNSEFIKNELEQNRTFFDDVNGRKLDEQQRIAIVTDEINNLIIAGAGSGKTLTIVGKVNYLVQKRGIDPKKILLISFTRKSTQELKERTSKNGIETDALTFHKLGLQIISWANKRPDVLDRMDTFLHEYFRDTIYESKTQLFQLITFFAIYLNIPQDIANYKNLGDYYNAQKNLKIQTLKDQLQIEEIVAESQIGLQREKKTLKSENVKSVEEAIIANYLFLHDIEYIYEDLYPYETLDQYRKSYRPDFFLPEYNIYIEHFGVTKSLKAPWLSPVEEKKYIDDMLWKQEFHKKNGTTLIETYSYYNSDGILIEKLQEKLIEHGVKIGNVEITEVFKRLIEKNDRCFDDFIELVSTFLCLFKSKNYDIKDFERIRTETKSNISNQFMRNRALVFIDLVEQIYSRYQEFLAKNHAIDFNDMINLATEIVKDKGFYRELTHIIIDEYQDVSFSRFNLVKAIREATNAKVVCVGDDWQSIYRFAGSDISLFTQFQDYFGYSELMRIENVYRNSQELSDIAASFIMQNDQQLEKKLVSDKHQTYPIRISYYNSLLEGLNNVIEEIAGFQSDVSSILLVGRNNADINFLSSDESIEGKLKKNQCFTLKRTKDEVKITHLKYPKLKINFLTAHRAKGLEADNVILINAKNDICGFPNRIVGDPLISLVLANNDKYEFSEERRLFYVAITRTRNLTYILAPISNPSIFINELIEKNHVFPMNDSDNPLLKAPLCPRCKTGRLVIRNSVSTGVKFLGCSNYPQCEYHIKQIDVMDNQIVCMKCGGFMVKRNGPQSQFYGCTNYPNCTNTLEIDTF